MSDAFPPIKLKPATYTFGGDQAEVAAGLERARQKLNFELNEFAAKRFGWAQAWERPDRNPMPHLDWWPWMDRPRQLRNEASVRIRTAWAALRHGARLDPDGDW